MKKILLVMPLLMSLCLFFLTNGAYAEETVSEKKETPKSDQMIIVNKAVNKLAFYEDGRLVHIFSVATGANASDTPEGDFHVEVKWECPIYYKGKNGPCENGNPLGPRWIGLSVPGTAGYTYGIHGNASAWSIGTYASHGCVRMHNSEVTQLFNIVKKNTPVTIIRSNKDFNEIAKDKGYVVKKAEKKQEVATVIGKTTVYYGAHEGLPSQDEAIENEEVVVTESIGEWQHIATKDEKKKTYWVNTKHLLPGAITKETSYVLLDNQDKILTSPKEDAKGTVLPKPKILSSAWHVGDWYFIAFDEKQTGWIQAKDVEKVTQKEWQTQENLSLYAKEWVEQWKSSASDNDDVWVIIQGLFG